MRNSNIENAGDELEMSWRQINCSLREESKRGGVEGEKKSPISNPVTLSHFISLDEMIRAYK